MKSLPKFKIFFSSFLLFTVYCLLFTVQTVSAESLNTCPAEIYLCGTPGPEPDAFYPYPGSSCYRETKEPQVITNLNFEVQKKIELPYSASGRSSVNWELSLEGETDNLKIPIVRQAADLFEGENPFDRKITLNDKGEIDLKKFGPISKLIPYTPIQDKLKQFIAVSSIDSQYVPPSGSSLTGEFAPNPIHDYIIAYAVPASGRSPSAGGGCDDRDWWYGGEEYKDQPMARPIRASEPDCSYFLKTGAIPLHSEANVRPIYAPLVCPKLYGTSYGAGNGLYVQKLKSEGKVFCPLSEQVLVEVWKKFMPLVSHETEPAQITITFDGKPAGKGEIYLPHLARLKQLSEIFQKFGPQTKPELETIFAQQKASNSPNQKLICPAKADIFSHPITGGGAFEVETPPFSKILKQSGSLTIAFPELLDIKENLIGQAGFFRYWLPKEITEKLDKEIQQEGEALEGEGKIRLTASGADSVSTPDIKIQYPFLNGVQKYYLEFVRLIMPKIE